MNLEIIPHAMRDIGEAAKYYREQRPGLDYEFLDEVDAATKMIASDPLLFEQVSPGIRRFLLERFPFGIYYRVRGSQLIVLAVFHARRNPDSWRARTKSG